MVEQVPVIKSKTSLSAILLLFFVALDLAVYSESARALDRDLDWQSAVLARSIFGMIVILPLAWSKRSAMVFFHKTLLLRSVLISIFLIGFVYAATVIPPADIITVMSTQPLWIAIISMVIFGTRYVKTFWVLCITLFTGVGLLASAGTTSAIWVIVVFTIFAIFRSMGTVLVLMLKEVPAVVQTLHLTIVMLLSSSLMFILYGGHKQLGSILDPKGIFLLLTIGITATLYQLFSVRVVQMMGTIAGGILPVVAVVFAYLMDIYLWGDKLELSRFLGMVLVLSSVAWLVFSKHLQKEEVLVEKSQRS